MEHLAELVLAPEMEVTHGKVAVVAPTEDHARAVADLLSPEVPTEAVVHAPDARAAAAEGAALVVLLGDPDADEVRLLADAPQRPWIVVVSAQTSPVARRRLLDAGAAAILRKESWRSVLAPACRAVMTGHVCVPAESLASLAPPALSLRERQVLALMVGGLSTTQIADRLFLAPSTVKSHMASAFRRLGVRSRRDAVAMILGSDEELRRIVLSAHPVHGPGVDLAAVSR